MGESQAGRSAPFMIPLIVGGLTRRKPAQPSQPMGYSNTGEEQLTGAHGVKRLNCGISEGIRAKEKNSASQMPPPSSKASPRACAWVTLLLGGTSRVSHTLPPIVEPWPMVTRPRMVAPA
jgi:hypothetical protein